MSDPVIISPTAKHTATVSDLLRFIENELIFLFYSDFFLTWSW
jgi:hypothetical protein